MPGRQGQQGASSRNQQGLIAEESVLDNLGEAILVIDSDFRITYLNKRAEELTRMGRSELFGKRCSQVLNFSGCKERCPVRFAAERAQGIIDYSAEMKRADGVRVFVSVRFSAIRNSGGHPSGGILSIRDFTSHPNLSRNESRPYFFEGIISRNPRILKILEILPDISRTDASVVIYGESGTGKDLFASAIHRLSLRRENPFVKVNCAALPDTLLESEFFGYVKGAFTDAKRDKPGWFQMAHKGTIFLDEIGDISPALQVKLLRVVEEKAFVPLGGTSTVHVDVRILAATNRSLESLVEEGRFRKDLYYRLNVVKLEIPSLRERLEDLSLLIEHFLSRFNQRSDRRIDGVSPEAMEVLAHYDYPGNVRELENIIEHACILCKQGLILKRHLPSYLMGIGGELEKTLGLNLISQIERKTIINTLRKHNWNKGKAAQELGIHRTTLWRKLKRMGS